MTFRIKRIYEPAEPADGVRVLVDRIWPRGISKAVAKLDHWDKDVAPTTKLRTWFGHKPERFAEFARRYKKELSASAALTDLRKMGRGRTVTLLYSARDPEHNQAVVLRAALAKR